MPFKSKSQLQTCYRKKDKKWNCDEFLEETKSVCCLPYKKGGKVRSRCLKNGERIKGQVQTGPRGGRFFVLVERDEEGEICTLKVYLPRE